MNTDKYECLPCGYIYDPAEGDSSADIAPGTSFDELPDDWVCPLCGAGKEEFSKINE
ncbi:MAG: rubredoxin [Bacteroidales bacterium]|nr:rubredoxin [Bacteroidales bacterium]